MRKRVVTFVIFCASTISWLLIEQLKLHANLVLIKVLNCNYLLNVRMKCIIPIAYKNTIYTTLTLSMIRHYSLPVFVDRSWCHAKRNRTIHIRHHSSSRRCTYGWWVCGFQTLQNQESPVRYDGINYPNMGIVDVLQLEICFNYKL